jgi:hypothetical protein
VDDPPKADIAVDTCEPVRRTVFFAETKSVAWWHQLIMDLDAKLIVDLSPGSGRLACAAMLSGAQYLGIARCPRHASWLQIALDRHALDFMTKRGSPFFEKDSAHFIQQHFQDVLYEVQEEAFMEDTVMASECGACECEEESDSEDTGPPPGCMAFSPRRTPSS